MSIKYKPICYGKIYENNDRDNDACNQSNRKSRNGSCPLRYQRTQHSGNLLNNTPGVALKFFIIRDAVYETKSKIDDGIVDLVFEAVKEGADRGGIVLS